MNRSDLPLFPLDKIRVRIPVNQLRDDPDTQPASGLHVVNRDEMPFELDAVENDPIFQQELQKMKEAEEAKGAAARNDKERSAEGHRESNGGGGGEERSRDETAALFRQPTVEGGATLEAAQNLGSDMDISETESPERTLQSVSQAGTGGSEKEKEHGESDGEETDDDNDSSLLLDSEEEEKELMAKTDDEILSDEEKEIMAEYEREIRLEQDREWFTEVQRMGVPGLLKDEDTWSDMEDDSIIRREIIDESDDFVGLDPDSVETVARYVEATKKLPRYMDSARNVELDRNELKKFVETLQHTSGTEHEGAEWAGFSVRVESVDPSSWRLVVTGEENTVQYLLSKVDFFLRTKVVGHDASVNAVVSAVPAVQPERQEKKGEVAASNIEQSPDSESKVAAAREAGRRNYSHFYIKFTGVFEAEYKDEGLHKNSVLGSMWNQHKKIYGSTCNGDCRCVFDMQRLTETVVQDQYRKKDSKWTNPSNLGVGEYPVGFVENFAEKFLPKLQAEYPRDSCEQLLQRLLSMWEQHRQQKLFTLKCRHNCECMEGWELVFNKGTPRERLGKRSDGWIGRKRKKPSQAASGSLEKETMQPQVAIPRKRKSASSKDILSGDSLAAKRNRGSFSFSSDNGGVAAFDSMPLPRKKGTVEKSMEGASIVSGDKSSSDRDGWTVYDLIFDSRNPLGFYCVNDEMDSHPVCKIVSVCPRGQHASDNRLQSGTLIVYTSIGESESRLDVRCYADLEACFTEATKNGTPIRLFFVNALVTSESVSPRGRASFSKDWSNEGQWRGRKNITGWDGGASVAIASVPSLTSVDHTDHQSAKKPGSTTDDGGDLQSVEETAPVHRSSAAERTNPVRATFGRCRVQFAGQLCHIRFFDKEQTPNEFAAYLKELKNISGTRPPSPSQDIQHLPLQNRTFDDLMKAVDAGTWKDVLDCLQQGDLVDVESIEPLNTERKKLKYSMHKKDEDLEKSSGEEKEKLKEQRRDLSRKWLLLKVYINAFYAVQRSRSLKYWEMFEFKVDKIVGVELLPFVERKPGSELSAEVFVIKEDRQEIVEKLPSKPFDSEISYDSSKIHSLTYNVISTPDRSIEIQLKMSNHLSSDSTVLGTVNVPVSELRNLCSHDQSWSDTTFSTDPEANKYLTSASVQIRARRKEFDAGSAQSKYNEARQLVTEKTLDWVQGFTDEVLKSSIGGNVRVLDNISLLHAAIFLRDEGLVNRLLQLGADPQAKSTVGSPLSLAQNMKDALSESDREDTADGRSASNERRQRVHQDAEKLKRIVKLLQANLAASEAESRETSAGTVKRVSGRPPEQGSSAVCSEERREVLGPTKPPHGEAIRPDERERQEGSPNTQLPPGQERESKTGEDYSYYAPSSTSKTFWKPRFSVVGQDNFSVSAAEVSKDSEVKKGRRVGPHDDEKSMKPSRRFSLETRDGVSTAAASATMQLGGERKSGSAYVQNDKPSRSSRRFSVETQHEVEAENNSGARQAGGGGRSGLSSRFSIQVEKQDGQQDGGDSRAFPAKPSDSATQGGASFSFHSLTPKPSCRFSVEEDISSAKEAGAFKGSGTSPKLSHHAEDLGSQQKGFSPPELLHGAPGHGVSFRRSSARENASTAEKSSSDYYGPASSSHRRSIRDESVQQQRKSSWSRPSQGAARRGEDSSERREDGGHQYNPSKLPWVSKKHWLLGAGEKECIFFQRGKCKFGANCSNSHIASPMGENRHFSGFVPSASVERHAMVKRGKDKWDREWWTAAWVDPQTNISYYAEEGLHGRKSDQGVWWYPTESDARDALQRVVWIHQVSERRHR